MSSPAVSVVFPTSKIADGHTAITEASFTNMTMARVLLLGACYFTLETLWDIHFVAMAPIQKFKASNPEIVKRYDEVIGGSVDHKALISVMFLCYCMLALLACQIVAAIN